MIGSIQILSYYHLHNVSTIFAHMIAMEIKSSHVMQMVGGGKQSGRLWKARFLRGIMLNML